MTVLRFPILLLLAALLPAQAGDKPGEEQPPLPPDLEIPPAPVLGPEAARESLRVAPGFRVELAAAEPLLHDPIALDFDAAGRMWVVEMRGFMPNVDGTGELEPNGRISVLEDADGDGVMDRSTTFLEDLVLPRAVLVLRDGVLVIEPPTLWWCRDTDGDLRCDERTQVDDGYDAGLKNPEHAGNGLLWGLDNWIHLAKHGYRYRRTPDGFVREEDFGGGQWGLTMDDRGRLWFNYNSDWLRMDRYPGHYGVRHPHLGRAPGLNHRVVQDQSVWPIRVTPGINRGYQEGMLIDGKLARTTAVCGPAVYRGGLFGENFRGDVFVCEPAANLVRRFRIDENGGAPRGVNAYAEAEFLASTDERFRPVNLYTGPDGALYVVDMYRGILQHRNFVTSWLRKQILERGLDEPLGLGRIWRVVPEGHEHRPPPDLAALPAGGLVAYLSHDNGVLRDTAQQEIAQRGAVELAPALRELARGEGPAVARVHALWSLEGLGCLERGDVALALYDDDPIVRATGVRLAEPFLQARRDALLLAHLQRLAAESEEQVLLQLALSLGSLRRPWGTVLLAEVGARVASDGMLRGVVVSGLAGRELEFLRVLQEREELAVESEGATALLRTIGRVLTARRDADEQTALLDRASATMRAWQQRALLQGMLDALPKGDRRRGWLVFAAPPAAFDALLRTGDPEIAARVRRLAEAVSVRAPEKAAEDASLTPEQAARFAAGVGLYGAHCAACHQRDGSGLGGLAPPLRDSDWLLGDAATPARIVLHGLRGPIEVAGEEWDLEMPDHRHLTDEQIAAILTYIRRAWGHRAAPVAPRLVQELRESTADRKRLWTAAELEAAASEPK